jgi:aryl-alcohol dehydrogenase-like predicted oxidoreductase
VTVIEIDELRPLGATGVRVSPLCLGAMMFGAWGNPDHDDCIAIIHRALDAGINMIDTADVYSFGESEQIVGKALAQVDRAQVILATKFQSPMGRDPNMQGGSRRWIIKACEDSLRRLGTDYIDIYQMHRPDPATDIDETLAALTDLVHHGKVRMIGTSTFPAERLVEAHAVAQQRGRERFRTEQPPYSILVRGIEGHVLPTAQQLATGVISWSPLAGGWLSGRFGHGRENTSQREQRLPTRPGGTSRYDLGVLINQTKLTLVTELTELAEQSGLSMLELAIGFVLEHPAISSAIIGPRTMDQLDRQLPAAHTRLATGVLDRIDEIVAPGVDVNPEDGVWPAPALTQPDLRRRSRIDSPR